MTRLSLAAQSMSGHARQNAVGYLALFVALSGTSYAAVQLPKNSVTSKQIKPGAVTQKKLSKPLRAQILAPGPAGTQGKSGPAGEKGATGEKGQTGDDGVLTSSFGTRNIASPVSLTTSRDSVLALSTPNSNGLTTGGPVVTTVPTRLIATAAVELFISSSVSALGRAACQLKLSTDGGTPAAIGNQREVTFESISPLSARFRTLSFVATVDVPAGSHDVSLNCSRFDRSDIEVTAPVTARNIDLSVVALRQR